MIADLPSWIDAQFLRTASGVLVVAAVLLVLVLIFAIRSFGIKVVSVLVLAAAVFGLVHYRETLQHCDKTGCSCKLLGQSVAGDNCSKG